MILLPFGNWQTIQMPDRIAQGGSFFSLWLRWGAGSKGTRIRSFWGRSVKKLVRSLSDRYAAVTSPLTCKRKTSCISRNPSLKTMKTTAATSLLPLKPAFSASYKSGTQSVALASSRRKDSFTCTTTTSHVRTTPSMAMSKRLLHMRALACTETSLSTANTHIVKKPLQAEELTLRAPSSAVALLRLGSRAGK